VYAT
jgi:hypothetical protein